MNLENCFNTMLEYNEATKSSFVKGYVSDWPENNDEPEVQETQEVGDDTTEE